MTLDERVNDYLKKFAVLLDREIRYFKEQSSFIEALNKAAVAEMSSGKSSHQRRIQVATLEKAQQLLIENKDRISSSTSFSELYCEIEKTRKISGIGELYVYDTSWRIGAYLGIEPDLVYIHAGTRKGSEALGFSLDRKTIDRKEFPPSIQRLQPIHIENFLCLYKDRFWNDQDAEKLIRVC